MKQVTTCSGRAAVQLADTCVPGLKEGSVLIANVCSILSPGTERAAIAQASESRLRKAFRKPDRIARILRKLQREGVGAFVKQATSTSPSAAMPLGYSSAGVVIACADGVESVRPGDRVASNGPHAEVVCVPQNLTALIPANVSYSDAAFTTLGAIALQGVRLSKTSLGETVVVIGLGLVGLVTISLLKLQGCRVIGLDLNADRCALALQKGADAAHCDAGRLLEATGRYGADAVIVTASTQSNAPLHAALDIVRKKGRVIIVGAVGMDIPRQKVYEKETEVVVSCSYGPGRYDPLYEERGADYPYAYVRWTERRNMEAILNLVNRGQLSFDSFVTHHFDIGDVTTAYDVLMQDTKALGIRLDYSSNLDLQSVVCVANKTAITRPVNRIVESPRLSVVGGGSYVENVMLPTLVGTPHVVFDRIASTSGMRAGELARRFGFSTSVSELGDILAAGSTDAVFLVNKHFRHSTDAESILRSGRHLYVEKPLCISMEQLVAFERFVEEEQEDLPILFVGFNRRFSPFARQVKEFFADLAEPLSIVYRFNAGSLPDTHWTLDKAIGGGRVIGEACHAIDFVTFINESLPCRVFADCVGGSKAPLHSHDRTCISIRHENGSLSNICYLSGGDSSLPKERIEVFGGGKVAVIDDFRTLAFYEKGIARDIILDKQDKGHRAAYQAFIDCVRGLSSNPFTWQELRQVTAASILAEHSIRLGVPLAIETTAMPQPSDENSLW